MAIDTPAHPSVATSLAGSLLIAMPTLRDPNFSHLVTLMISHDEGGAFGIVLGPATTTAVHEISQNFGVTWQRTGAATHVALSGPVTIAGDGSALRGGGTISVVADARRLP